MAARKGSLTQYLTVVFNHKKESHTLRQYYEMHKNSLPAFIIVTQGFFGGSEMEVLGNGQVLRIHSCVYQKRAVAVDSNNRTLSIPTNYPLKFKLVDSKNKVGKEEDTLCNILVKKPLPVKVQISDSKQISFSMNLAEHTSKQNVHSLGVLTIQEVYEEVYLLSNAITLTDGEIDNTASLIPLYLGDIMVSPITGIEGKSQTDWQAYQNKLTDECKRVQIPLDTGLKEIALYSPNSIANSENIYEYIEPSNYIVADWEGKTNEGTYTVTKQTLRPPPIKPKPSKLLPQASQDKGPPLIPARTNKSQPSPDPIESDKPNPPYANVIGRATVAPFAKIAAEAANMATGSDVRTATEKKVEGQGQQDEKPVAQLSIQEVAAKLKDLKLEKYAKAFKEQGVDGELAMDLDETILKEEFKFSKFESLKFLKFVKTGHIPK